MPSTKRHIVIEAQPVNAEHMEMKANQRCLFSGENRVKLVYLKTGVAAITTALGRYIVPPKQVFWLVAGLECELITLSDAQVLVWQVDPAILISPLSHSQVLEVDTFLSALLLEATKIPVRYQWASSDGRLLRLMLDRLMISPSIKLRLPYPKDSRLRQITERIRAHPTLKTDLVAWAKFVGASVRTLSRRFKSETGMTYREWKQRLNIQIAINQLYFGDSVAHIAKHLGYDSSSAFIFMFKKHLHVTPSQYQKRFLSNASSS